MSDTKVVEPQAPESATSAPAQAPAVSNDTVFEKRLQAIEEARKAADERNTALESQIAELKARASAPAEPAKPDPSVADRLARLELKDSLRLRNNEQAAAVHSIIQENPKLSPAEAMAIAAQRDPKTFGQPDPRGFDPARGGALPPGGMARREPEPQKTTLDHMREIGKSDNPHKYKERGKLALKSARERIGAVLDQQV